MTGIDGIELVAMDTFLELVASVTEADAEIAKTTPLRDFDSLQILSIVYLVEELGGDVDDVQISEAIRIGGTIEDLYTTAVSSRIQRAVG